MIVFVLQNSQMRSKKEGSLSFLIAQDVALRLGIKLKSQDNLA